jgi:hypothetical protein
MGPQGIPGPAGTSADSSTLWGLAGNTGTVAGTSFVGTTDNVALEFKVNGQRALRIVPHSVNEAPTLIGGYSGNGTTGLALSVTIGGGGMAAAPNTATGGAHFGTIAGGYKNTVGGFSAVVGGGNENTADGDASTVGGGRANFARGLRTTVAGGDANIANGNFATIAGGIGNGISASEAAIGGGYRNFVGQARATIAGGNLNIATGLFSSIGGGDGNEVEASAGTIGGGNHNHVRGESATIAGGEGNVATGPHASVPGGLGNEALGRMSFAAGYRAIANDDGAFVWADATGGRLNSTARDQFMARASGGVTFYTDSAASVGARLAPGSGSWAVTSDRASKSNLTAVDGREVLARLAGIPMATWNYKTQDATIRHIGPMAQDFMAAFGVGEDEKQISTVDADGVALAAIQGLNQVVQEKERRIQSLEQEMADLRQIVQQLTRNVPAR